MTTYDRRKEKLIKELKDKEYRDAFVSEHIDTGIPFQIKAVREQRGWTQKQLGENVVDIMKQEQISRLEDANYSKFSLTTLKRLASAFDVGLMVRFVPVSDLVKWELGLSSESLKAESFDQECYFKEIPGEISPTEKASIVLSNATETSTEGYSGEITAPDNITLFRESVDNQAFVPTDTLRAVGTQ